MKLLLVSYYYPPMGGAGVQRALKFSKYLGEFGVQPVVLAAEDASYPQDPSLAADVPAGLKVLRVPYQPMLQRLLARRNAASAPASALPAASSPSSRSAAAAPAHARWRDAALGLWAAAQFPDDKAGWVRRALAPARALLRDERIEMILSTAPPIAAHALARRLAREAGLPWVADYRDLWADNPGYLAPAWRRALDRRTEARWLHQAAGVVTVTPGWQRRFEQQLGAATPVACIPNGYDEADFAALPAPSSAPHARVAADGAFRLVHTGSFYGPRDPATLLDGLARYLQAAPATSAARTGARPLRLRLVGQIGSRFDAALAQFDARHPGVVERRAYVPHPEALAEMMAADALLLVVGAGPRDRLGAVVAGTLPGKVFEYLRSGRPILLLGDPQGDAAALLRQHGRGWVADETQPAQIAEALAQMMAAPAPPAPRDAEVSRFERRALAGELAAFLRRCRGEGAHG